MPPTPQHQLCVCDAPSPCVELADNWNRFDFTVVLGTNAGIILTALVGGSAGAIGSIVRTFRVGR